MVRFIMFYDKLKSIIETEFTFQYGQIYYDYKSKHEFIVYGVYIPIWLDLLYTMKFEKRGDKFVFTFQYGQIYYIF